MADPERITRRLETLWQIAHGLGGGADRPAYSAAEAKAMRIVAGWAEELDLQPAIDPHGNLWALPDGDGPVVTAGSHVDTVPDGGRYDGALGTVLGLELAAGARMSSAPPPAGVLICAAEEAPRFGAGTVGSRLLTGALREDDLAGLRDADGISALEARDDYLERLSDLPRVAAPPLARLQAHAEIHVALRFGPAEIGVVTRVASPRRVVVTVDGESGHAGEVSMQERHDALAAAAEITLAIEAAAQTEPVQTVATVGTLTVEPGAVSVIPGRARLGVDMRAIDGDSLRRLDGALRAAVEAIAARRGVRAAVTTVRAGEPVAMDAGLVCRALEGARRLSIRAAETWSGAGHDAQHLNALVPSLLLFVPLRGGQSHTPQEGADLSEILAAAEVAASALWPPGA